MSFMDIGSLQKHDLKFGNHQNRPEEDVHKIECRPHQESRAKCVLCICIVCASLACG